VCLQGGGCHGPLPFHFHGGASPAIAPDFASHSMPENMGSKDWSAFWAAPGRVHRPSEVVAFGPTWGIVSRARLIRSGNGCYVRGIATTPVAQTGA